MPASPSVRSLGPDSSFVDSEQADFDRLYGVNVGGVVNGCRAAIRQFEAQGGGGVIVNTASVAGLIGYGGVIYGSSKGAVTLLTRTLALEVAPQGIRVNSVCPAGMPTNFIPGMATSDLARQSMAATHPLGRPIEPEECANAALFLASDLSSNITGVNLPVDGGLSAGVPMKR
jgi:NAD(P)-dependent dehydrogenase (short-subunit alcohol dehydrogenase family)